MCYAQGPIASEQFFSGWGEWYLKDHKIIDPKKGVLLQRVLHELRFAPTDNLSIQRQRFIQIATCKEWVD